MPLSELKGDNTLLATVNPNIHFSDICRDGGIQTLSQLPDLDSGSPNYLLGPGQKEVSLYDIIMEEYAKNHIKDESKGR